MIRSALSATFALLLLLAAIPAIGQELVFPPPEPADQITDGKKIVDLQAAWPATGVRPGEATTLAVVFQIRPDWHINAPDVPEPFIPTKLQVTGGPAGVTFSTPIFPKAEHKIDLGFGDPVAVYDGRVIVYVPLAVGPSVAPGEHVVKLAATWQACEDSGVCLMQVTVPIEAKLNVVAPGAAVEPTNAELFAGYKAAAGAAVEPTKLSIPFFGWDFDIDPQNLLILLPIAALGGLLLNFTPCVLPLVPIKVLGMAQAGGTRRRTLLLGVATFAGVGAFWLALGVAISTVSGFTATNQLFQYPAFTITVGAVIAIMAVGMLGAYAVRLPQWIYFVNPKQETLPGSFAFGIMIAVLSTPCTAPAMGAAAAWAATQSPALTLSTFVAIGVGMALPYLILAAFPALVDRMPRTGPASELIKQVMGLLLVAAAAYFLGTGLSGLLTEAPDPPSRLYWWFVAAAIVLAGVWLAWRTVRITSSSAKRVIFVTLGAATIAAGLFIGVDFTRHGPVKWIYYTPERLAAAQAQGKVVVLEFTAEWCLNCKVLEQAVLHTDAVSSALNASDVAPIKIDLTGNNEPGNAKLLAVGRRTIPLLVVLGPDGREVFKSDAYTPQQVLDAIDRARTPSN